MEPVEIIYNGYATEHEDNDTEETKEAADSFLHMIESLLPNSQKMQDVLFSEGITACSIKSETGIHGRLWLCGGSADWQE